MMTDELEQAAELVAPQIALPVKAVKIGLACLAALIVAVLLGWVIWKLFFAERAAQQKHDIVQAQGQQAVSAAGAAAGKDAVPIIVKNYTTGAAIDAQTQEAIRDILKAPGAAQAVDPALDDLGRKSICLRSSAAGLPDCQHLQRSDP